MPARSVFAVFGLVAALAFAGQATAGGVCGKMSVDCTCECTNGMEINWEDAFKLPSSCKGTLCSDGCVVDLDEALRKCAELYNRDYNKACISRESQIRKRCAVQDGGKWSKWWKCDR